MERLKTIFFALNKSERVLAILGVLIMVASGGALAMGAFERATTVVPARGGEYAEGFIGQPTYLNPVLASSDIDKSLVRLLFASLKELAAKIEAGENGRVWTVRLKEELAWSNGQKITSDDIIFTVQKIQDPETRSPLFSKWQGVVANRVSELELQFNLAAPYQFFAENIEGLYPIPKHLFAETPPANWRLSQYILKPVGNGPYAVESLETRPDGFITSYHFISTKRSFASEPHLQNFVVNFYPNGERLAEAINAASIDGFADINPDLISKINRPYQLLSFPMPNYYAVFFNQGQNLALKEFEVRAALDSALDRKDLVEKIFSGRAAAIKEPLPATLAVGRDLTNSSTSSSTSPEAMLEGAGWKVGSDGIREKQIKNSSLKLEISLSVPNVPFLLKGAQMVQESWNKIGARVNLIVLQNEEVDKVIKNRTYQALLFGNILSPHFDFYPFWHSNERFFPGLNLALYNRKEADQKIESLRTVTDENLRIKDILDLAALISSDRPATFLFSVPYLMVASKDLKGVSDRPLTEPADRFQNVSEWHTRTTRTFK